MFAIECVHTTILPRPELQRESTSGNRKKTHIECTYANRGLNEYDSTAFRKWRNGILSRIQRGTGKELLLLSSASGRHDRKERDNGSR